MLHGVHWILQVASGLEDREVTIPMSNHWINRIQAMRNNRLTRYFFFADESGPEKPMIWAYLLDTVFDFWVQLLGSLNLHFGDTIQN